MRVGLGVAVTLLVVFVAQAAGIGGSLVRGPLAQVAYFSVLVIAAGSCLARAVLVERERAAWAVLGFGLAIWTAGDVYWTLVLADMERAPYPSPADACYLVVYPATYAGLGLLLAQRLLVTGPRERQPGPWLDGVAAGLAVGAVVAALAADGILQAGDGDMAAVAVNLAYPTADLVLVAMIVATLTVTGARPGLAWTTLAVALAFVAASDIAYLDQSLAGTYVENGITDAGWMLGALLIGAAAWMRPRPVKRRRMEGRQALAVPAIVALAVTGVLLAGAVHHLPPVALALAAGALLVTFVRAGLAFAENERLYGQVRRDATTDLTTGLGNRRRLVEDLEACLAGGSREEPWLLAFLDLNGFKRFNDAFGHHAGDLLLQRLGGALQDCVAARGGTAYRVGGDEFCALLPLPDATPEAICEELRGALREDAGTITISCAAGSVVLPDEATGVEAALQLADRRMYVAKHGRGSAVADQTRALLMQTLLEREPELRDHVAGVADLAVAVGRALGMGNDELDEVHRAAELHDLGKMAIPDAVLHKEGPLDPDEWALMHQHTVIGARILDTVPAMRPVARIVRASHEHWDGSGYPDGLRGEEIPLGARIVLVCDAFHAITSARAYKPALPVDAAIAELVQCSGRQFDPAVVDTFLALRAAATPITAARL